jgi:hypothetical protein
LAEAERQLLLGTTAPAPLQDLLKVSPDPQAQLETTGNAASLALRLPPRSAYIFTARPD